MASTTPLRYLLDEHLRGMLHKSILRHNMTTRLQIDVAQVGDPPDLPLGSSDAKILLWAERENRIVVSRDDNTMPLWLTAHLEAGNSSPGVMIPRNYLSLGGIVEWLALAAYASEASEWANQVRYLG